MGKLVTEIAVSRLTSLSCCSVRLRLSSAIDLSSSTANSATVLVGKRRGSDHQNTNRQAIFRRLVQVSTDGSDPRAHTNSALHRTLRAHYCPFQKVRAAASTMEQLTLAVPLMLERPPAHRSVNNHLMVDPPLAQEFVECIIL